MSVAFRNVCFASLSLMLFTAIGSSAALAQGSSGGSIGNDDKSVSGSRPEPRSIESDRPARRGKPEAEAPQRAPRKPGGGGGNFDGVVGVVAPLEVMRAARESVKIALPLELVIWAEEEGTTFGLGMIGSISVRWSPTRR